MRNSGSGVSFPVGGRKLKKQLMALGNDPVALEGLESDYVEEKRVGAVDAMGLQKSVSNLTGVY